VVTLAAPPVTSGPDLQTCLSDLAANLGLLSTYNQAQSSMNDAVVSTMAASPFLDILNSLQDVVNSSASIDDDELTNVVNSFMTNNLQNMLGQVQDNPLNLGPLLQTLEGSFSQLIETGASPSGSIFAAVQNLFNSLRLFNPASIVGMMMYAMQYGETAVIMQQGSLQTLKRLVQSTNSMVLKGSVPTQPTPVNPFTEALNELCLATNDLDTVQSKLTNESSFDAGHCSSGAGHLLNVSKILVNGKNTVSFFEQAAKSNFNVVAAQAQALAATQWLPNYQVFLQKEAILVLAAPIGQTNSTLYNLTTNISTLIPSFQIDFGLEAFMAQIIGFLITQIQTIQSLLKTAMQDPTGNIATLSTQRDALTAALQAQTASLSGGIVTPSGSAAQVASLQLQIEQLNSQITGLGQAAQNLGNVAAGAPIAMANAVSAQVQALVQVTSLVMIAQTICQSFKQVQSLLNLQNSLNPNQFFKQIQSVISRFSTAPCTAFKGTDVLCNLGKYADALNASMAGGSVSPQQVATIGRQLLTSIVAQEQWLTCTGNALNTGNSQILEIMSSLGISPAIVSQLMQGMNPATVLAFTSLDFDSLFTAGGASSINESLLQSLSCVLNNTDNPGVVNYVNTLMTNLNTSKQADDTVNVDYTHMASEAKLSNKFKGNNNLNIIQQLLGTLQSIGTYTAGLTQLTLPTDNTQKATSNGSPLTYASIYCSTNPSYNNGLASSNSIITTVSQAEGLI
jgi:hypothetical protein